MLASETLRAQLAELLSFSVPAAPHVEVRERAVCAGYERQALRYRVADGDVVDAFFLRPQGAGPFPAVVAYHQHNSQWHLGKSEVAGVAGDPLQAFGPALAARGVAVIAPDQLGFEDRRRNARGTAVGPDDWLEYYNAMAYRLLRGELLMTRSSPTRRPRCLFSLPAATSTLPVSARWGIRWAATRCSSTPHSTLGSASVAPAARRARSGRA